MGDETPPGGRPRPPVSIGMPVYNAEKYLERAIDSLLRQDYPEFELIISDNASTDGTLALIRRYAARDARVKVHRNEANEGAAANFRKVFALARGKYFMWAAGDDFWSENYVSSLVEQHEKEPGAILAAGSTCFVGIDGSRIERRDIDPAPPMPSSHLSSARTFLSRQICSWIYGLYDRELAAEALPILWRERPWGGDAVFVFHLCLNYRVLGESAGILYKREGSGAQLQPPNKRSMAAWQVWYAGALLRELRKSPLSVTSRLWLCLSLVRHFRRVAGGIINLVIIWVRAGIEISRGHRDIDAARTGH